MALDSINADDNDHEKCEPTSPLQRAMNVIYTMMRNRVYMDGGARNFVGLIFYGTKATKNEINFKNVFEYHWYGVHFSNASVRLKYFIFLKRFGGIDVERLHDVHRFVQDPDALVAELHGFTERSVDTEKNESSLYRALWLCNFCFSSVKFEENDEKTIWLFTRDDNPHRNNRVLKSKLEQRFEVCMIKSAIETPCTN